MLRLSRDTIIVLHYNERLQRKHIKQYYSSSMPILRHIITLTSWSKTSNQQPIYKYPIQTISVNTHLVDQVWSGKLTVFVILLPYNEKF